jgi:hypothetical protein
MCPQGSISTHLTQHHIPQFNLQQNLHENLMSHKTVLQKILQKYVANFNLGKERKKKGK